MRIQRRSPTSGRSERGDTIVEVLVAIAILGAVLGGAYVVVSRNVGINQASQERMQAVKIAESQFERLKIVTSSNTTAFTWSNFCLTQTNTRATTGQAACKVDANGAPTSGSPQYAIGITNVAYVPLNGNSQAGTRFKISVSWEDIKGGKLDTLDYFYEVYR